MWSGIHIDILELILAKLDLRDHLCFGSVCKSWRSAALLTNYPATKKPFYMVRSSKSTVLIRQFLQSHPLLPPYFTSPVGAFEAWLVYYASTTTNRVFLVNGPITITLPSLPPLRSLVRKVVLPSDPTNSSNCTIVANNLSSRLTFCRPGDEAWGTLDHTPVCRDIIFQNNRLHALGHDGTLFVFDPDLKSRTLKLCLPPWDDTEVQTAYIADFCGKLLVMRMAKYLDCFEVLEIIGSSCVELKRLGGDDEDDKDVLLVSNYFHLALTSKEHPEFKKNRIYVVPDADVLNFQCDKNIYYALDHKATATEDREQPRFLFMDLFSH